MSEVYLPLLEAVEAATSEDELISSLDPVDNYLNSTFEKRKEIYASEALVDKTRDVLIGALTRSSTKKSCMITLHCIYHMVVSFHAPVKAKFATEQFVNLLVQKAFPFGTTDEDASLIFGRVICSLADHPQGAKLLATAEVREGLVQMLPLLNYPYDSLFGVGRILRCRDAVPIFADTSSTLLDVIKKAASKFELDWQTNVIQRDVITVLESHRNNSAANASAQQQPARVLTEVELLRQENAVLKQQVVALFGALSQRDAEIAALKQENEQLRNEKKE